MSSRSRSPATRKRRRAGEDREPLVAPPEEEREVSKKDKKEKKKEKKDKKREKKEKKKEKKRLKNEKKRAKLEKKIAELAEKAKDKKKKAKGKKKKGSSSSSSSSSSSPSSDSSLGLNFVLDREFGRSGEQMDPRNPDRKIQKALGLTCGSFSFIDRDDDSQVAKEFGYGAKFADGKVVEDTSRDWICQRSKANGDPCGARNFMRNEYCITCGALKPRSAVLQSRDVKGTKLDGYKYR